MLNLVPFDGGEINVFDWHKELVFGWVELATLFKDRLRDQLRVRQQLSQIVKIAHFFIYCHVKSGVSTLRML